MSAQKRKNIGIILAGGTGERFRGDQPKQFFKVAGKSVLEHTVDIFQKIGVIDEIAIIVHQSFRETVEKMIIKNCWNKVKKVLQGGEERYLSSLAAINAYSGNDSINLIFHDAVRPMVSEMIIETVVQALNTYDAVDVAIPASDTILRIDPQTLTIAEIPNRKLMYQGQTPQGFKIASIKKAYELALADPDFTTTDDCGVIAKYMPDTPVYIVKGEVKNIKLTFHEDLYFIDKLFQLKSIEMNSDDDLLNLKGKVLVVFGGNSGIGEAICNLSKDNGAVVYSFSRSTTKTDICSIKDVERDLKIVYQQEKKIDFVVVTAAVLKKDAFHLMNLEEIHTLIDINHKGPINVSWAAFKYLRESQGQLLHFTSSSYTLGRPFYSLYSSSKAAIVNLTQALAQEWAEFGIKVNCINPERTDTVMRAVNFGVEDKSTLLKAEHVASVSISILLSCYTGQVVDVRLKKEDPKSKIMITGLQ